MHEMIAAAARALTLAILTAMVLLGPRPVAAQAREPEAKPPLAIARIVLVEKPAASYRDPELTATASVPADQPLHIYVEPTGMTTRYERGAVKALLVIDMLAKSSEGKVVRDGKAVLRIPFSVKAPKPAPLADAYSNITIDALKLDPGIYELVVRFNDGYGSTFSEQSITFTQTPARDPSPARRKAPAASQR
jgi:hypothetical protein